MKTGPSVKEFAEMQMDRKVQDGFVGKARWLAGQSKAREFLNSTHLCQMKVGDAKSGEPQLMTGAEMKARNKRFEDQFWKALDKNEHARMSRWFLVK